MKEINKFAMDTRQVLRRGGGSMLRAVLDMLYIEVTVYDNGRVDLRPAEGGSGPVYTFFGPNEK